MLKRIVWIALLLLVAFGVWRVLRPRPVAVDWAEVTRGTVRSFVEEEGKTRVKERYVVSAPVAGRLRRVALDEGDVVEEGDLLAEIDPLPLESRVQEVEANIRALRHRAKGVDRKKPKASELERARVLEQVARDQLAVAKRQLEEAQAALELAGKDVERDRGLVRAGTGTQAELDASEAAERRARALVEAGDVRIGIRRLEIAAARLNVAIWTERLEDYDWQKADLEEQIAAFEASLAALRDDLARARVVAPAKGSVLDLFEESEREVAAGTPILDIGDLSGLEVEADFLSEDVAHMKMGMKAEIFGRALGERVLPGKIERIHPSAFEKISSLGVEQQRVRVVVGFGAGAAGLGDRYRVEVRILLDAREDAILVPEGALFRHEGAWHVFTIEGVAARLTAVETGLRDGLVREVTSGLRPGDRVVLHPDGAVEDGVAVRALTR